MLTQSDTITSINTSQHRTYSQTFNISSNNFQNLNASRLVLHLSLPNLLKPVDNKDAVGAAPTSDVPTTSAVLPVFGLPL